MEKTFDEKEVAVMGLIKLTNKRIVLERRAFWERDTKEMPLYKVDSISYGHRRNRTLFLIGVLLIFGSLISLQYNLQLTEIGLVIGVIIAFLGLLKYEFIEIRATTLKLYESGKGANKFAESVMKELTKKVVYK